MGIGVLKSCSTENNEMGTSNGTALQNNRGKCCQKENIATQDDNCCAS